jgi:UDP-N-acetyl-2-amino-2-deoxyglucuronate dehydrogenase
MKNFAIVGLAGFVAPRHLKAIHDTGNRLVAAADPNDSVGILDRYSFEVKYFREIERFDRHLEKLRRGPEADRVHYVSICTPNYLHDAHVRLAFRVDADAICEKPLVINPWNLDALRELEQERGRRVWTVLQLRLHPALLDLKRRLGEAPGSRRHEVVLTYITARGPWYHVSWKGTPEKSGGLAANIGIHFFDLLMWLFGGVEGSEVHLNEPSRMAGTMELARASVRWYLSVDIRDLPFPPEPGKRTTFRSITIDGKEVEFTEGFTDLHTLIYDEILDGRGFGIEDARPSIEFVHKIRISQVKERHRPCHPLVEAKR